LKQVFIILSCFFLSFSLVQNVEANSTQFSDVKEGYWAEKEIEYIAELGIIKGLGNGKFGPDQDVKRAQAAIMIARALGLEGKKATSEGFEDIPEKHFAYNEITILREKEILPKDKKYRPNDSLNRMEMAQILVKGFQLTGEYKQPIKDVSTTHWAHPFVTVLAANGITTIYPDQTFKPNDKVTRAQFAVFLYRTLGKKIETTTADYQEDFTIDNLDQKEQELFLKKVKELTASRKGKTAEQVAQEVVDTFIKESMTDFEKIKILHDYIILTSEYDYDNYMNNTVPSESYTPYGILVLGIGVCEAYTTAFELLLDKVGIENKQVMGTAIGPKGEQAHTWNLVLLNGEYYHIDVTWDDEVKNDTNDKTSYYYFLESNQSLMGHTWNKNNYPDASSDKYFGMANGLKKYGDWYYYHYSTIRNGIEASNTYRVHKDARQPELFIANASIKDIQGGWVYYSDEKNDNKLYKIKVDKSKVKQVTPNYALRIHFVGDWIYYESSFSMYKVKKDGTNATIVTDDVVVSSIIKDGWIYYVNFGTGPIIKMKTDGTQRTQLIEYEMKATSIIGVQDGWIYFNVFDGDTYKMTINGEKIEKL
jgi:hypothetical protein